MKNSIIIAAFVLLVVVAINFATPKKESAPVGSVAVGNDYYSTTTRSFSGTALTNLTVLRTTSGALARVTVTGANTGIIRLWDATTTDVTRRMPNTASTTILVAEIPASAAANTYDFDADLRYGLIYELVSGLAPTSTISYR